MPTPNNHPPIIAPDSLAGPDFQRAAWASSRPVALSNCASSTAIPKALSHTAVLWPPTPQLNTTFASGR